MGSWMIQRCFEVVRKVSWRIKQRIQLLSSVLYFSLATLAPRKMVQGDAVCPAPNVSLRNAALLA